MGLIFKEEQQWKAFGNRVLRSIYGFKREGVRGEWRILHSKFHNFYSLSNIWVIKLRRMKCEEHVLCMGR
jgi:hypothetical protein